MPTAKTESPLVPDLEIVVNGSPLPVDITAGIVRVEVDDDTNLPGMFAVELAGSDDPLKPALWIDDARFSVGHAVEIKMGYVDDLATLIAGEITGLEPEFAVDRLPSLIVRGYDRRHRLLRGRKTRTFVQKKDSDIAAQIAGEAGLSANAVDSQVTHEYVLQAGQTDMEFLQERARRIQYEVAVQDKALHFRPVANAESEALTLRLEEDLLEFYPRLSSVRQVSKVTVQGWSLKDKKAIAASASAVNANMGGQKTGAVLAEVFGRADALVGDRPVMTQAEADQMAKARFNNVALALITGDGVCLGRTDLRAGKVIDIEDIGARFSGRYYVTAASHRYTPQRGYLTHFTVRRNAS